MPEPIADVEARRRSSQSELESCVSTFRDQIRSLLDLHEASLTKLLTTAAPPPSSSSALASARRWDAALAVDYWPEMDESEPVPSERESISPVIQEEKRAAFDESTQFHSYAGVQAVKSTRFSDGDMPAKEDRASEKSYAATFSGMSSCVSNASSMYSTRTSEHSSYAGEVCAVDYEALLRMPARRSFSGEECDGEVHIRDIYESKPRFTRAKKSQIMRNFTAIGSHEVVIEPSWRFLSALNPDAGTRTTVDMLGILMLVHDAIMVPYIMAWDMPASDWEIGLWTTRIFWTVDLPLSFITGYRTEDQKLELRLFHAMKHYFRTWFLMDLMLVFVDWIGFFLKEVRIFRFARLRNSFRIMRLIRAVSKVPRATDLWGRIVLSNNKKELILTLKVVQMIFLIAWVNHIVCCGWYSLGRWTTGDTDETWLQNRFSQQRKYLHSPAYEYATALHWAITQMTPGSMEVVPYNTAERLYTVFVLLFGLVMGSSLTATLTSIMTQYRLHLEAKSKKSLQLQLFLSQNSVDPVLVLAIRRHVAILEKQKVRVKARDVEYLKDIPKSMKQDLQYHLCSQVLRRHALFQSLIDFEDDAMHHMVNVALISRDHTVGEYVFEHEAVGEKVFFLVEGQLQYEPGPHAAEYLLADEESSKKLHYLSKGDWCGEPCLWVVWRHLGGLCAHSASEVLSLSADSLADAFQSFPRVMDIVCHYGRAFNFHLNERGVLKSDLPSSLDYDEVMFKMEPSVRMQLVTPAIEHLVKGQHLGARFFNSVDVTRLTEEVEAGKCHVAFVNGEVMRIVFVVALRLYRAKGDRFLFNICDVHVDKNMAVPTGNLPGTKKRQDETLVGAVRRILETELLQVQDEVDIFIDQGADKTSTVKDSPTFGMRTRYLRIAFDASLRKPMTSFPAVEVPRRAAEVADRARSKLDFLHAPSLSLEDRSRRLAAVEVLTSIHELYRVDTVTGTQNEDSPKGPRNSLRGRLSLAAGVQRNSFRGQSSASQDPASQQVKRFYIWATKEEVRKVTHPAAAPILREWANALQLEV